MSYPAENIPCAPVTTTQRNGIEAPRPTSGELAERRGDRVEDRVVERVALLRVGDRQPQDSRRRLVDQQLAVGQLASPDRRRTASLLQHDQRVALADGLALLAADLVTVPASSASTGISIFIDSRIATVSPSSIASPTSHSIFHTVPVM